MKQQPPRPYEVGALDRMLAFVGGLTPALLQAGISSSIGPTLRHRVDALRAWSQALFEGRRPSSPTWFNDAQCAFFENELKLPFEDLRAGNKISAIRWRLIFWRP